MTAPRPSAPEPGGAALSLAVVVPAHQAAAEVGACLAGLLAAGFQPGEVLVVDDGSTDGTGAVARAASVHVLRHDIPLRPARARNAGVAATTSDVVVFVDADVVVHPDTRARIEAFFRDHPHHVALFGSYDDAPASARPVSRYRNLLHHWVHQHAPAEADTFWTGLGAVRRDAFEAVGGLDPAWESIEDVELGTRLVAAGGRVRLDRGLLGQHLKAWTLRSMLLTDWRGRAVPWTRLLAQGRVPAGALNLSWRHRASAALVLAMAILMPLSLLKAGLLWGTGACVLAFIALNARFLRLLWHTGGPLLASQAVVFHALHYAAALGGHAEARLFSTTAPRDPAIPARPRSGP